MIDGQFGHIIWYQVHCPPTDLHFLPLQLDLKHVDQVRGSNIVNIGIDLSEFYLSIEWDILEVPATRNEEYYLPQVSVTRYIPQMQV